MSETKKADTQRLMQLIVKSSKVTTLAMQSVKSALQVIFHLQDTS